MTLCLRASKALRPSSSFFSFFELRRHCSSNVRLLTTEAAESTPESTTTRRYKDLILRTYQRKSFAYLDERQSWSFEQFHPVITNPDLLAGVISSMREKREAEVALRFFKWIRSQPGFKCSESAFCALLEVLVDKGMMRKAYWVAERAIGSKMDENIVDVLISNRSTKILDLLLEVYTKISTAEQRLLVFRKMIRNGMLPDVKNCNKILKVLRDKKEEVEAMQVYRMMGEFGVKPTTITYNTMLDLLADPMERDLLSEMVTAGCAPNDSTYNVLINMHCSKRGDVESASALISEMIQNGLRVSLYTYNPLISLYCKRGLFDEALDIRNEMKTRGVSPTVSTYNALIHGFCKYGRISDAEKQFEDMGRNKLMPDIISYNSLIYGYCRLRRVDEAFHLFDELIRLGLRPTVVTYNTLIDGLCRSADLEGGRKLKSDMVVDGIRPDVFTYTILVNGSCKSGNMSMAEEFLDEMQSARLYPGVKCKSGKPYKETKKEGIPSDVFAYNTRMLAVGISEGVDSATRIYREMKEAGYPEKILRLFEEMLRGGVKPTMTTFVMLLRKFERWGFLKPASIVWSKMVERGYSPDESAYNAWIDALVDKGLLDEAWKYHQEMQKKGLSSKPRKVFETRSFSTEVK
ncbi:Pentatricopeptide repeat-containing protein At1g22960, mitochondrial [Linum grandiflorum]